MSSADQINVMLLAEGGDYLLPEGKADSSIIFTPALDIFIWGRPEQIA